MASPGESLAGAVGIGVRRTGAPAIPACRTSRRKPPLGERPSPETPSEHGGASHRRKWGQDASRSCSYWSVRLGYRARCSVGGLSHPAWTVSVGAAGGLTHSRPVE
jgi:hypothetical protein